MEDYDSNDYNDVGRDLVDNDDDGDVYISKF